MAEKSTFTAVRDTWIDGRLIAGETEIDLTESAARYHLGSGNITRKGAPPTLDPQTEI